MNDEEALWLWRCILGREPESADALRHFKVEGRTFEEGRKWLLNCEEFLLANPRPQAVYYIPERFPQAFVRSPRSLCLACIVKDEAVNIENLLLSCYSILSYIVIVDTGSIDDTAGIAERILLRLGVPHLIAHVPFENFAQARNAALERVPASMDWILMLDADEEIVPADYWRFAALLENDAVDAWHLPRFNFVDASKRMPVENYPDYQLRLLRNRLDQPIRFVNKVHERPNLNVWTDAPAANCEKGDIGGPHIHHLGAIGLTRERWQKKHDFYMRLTEQT